MVAQVPDDTSPDEIEAITLGMDTASDVLIHGLNGPLAGARMTGKYTTTAVFQ